MAENEEIKNEETQEEEGKNPGEQASETGGSPSEENDGEESETGEGGDRLEEDEEEEVDSETLALAKLLKNPETRSAVIAALAKDANVEKKVSEGQTSKQIVKSIRDDLRNTLGPDWHFLADKLTPVFDAMLTHVAKLESQLSNSMEKQVTDTSNAAAEKFFSTTPEAKKYEGTMIKLMEDYNPPTDPSKLQSYLNRLYVLAKAETAPGKQTGKMIADKAKERIEKNSQQTGLKPGSKDATPAPQVFRTTREAVLAAQEALKNKK